jgi:diguanylate cyclase (GGDEF)-like protein/PAS domain S-box-containing protein
LILQQLPSYLASSRYFTLRLISGLLLLNLLVIGLVGWVLNESRVEYQQQARTTSQNLSRMLEYDIGSTFDRIDLVLKNVVDEFETQLATGRGDESRLNSFLGRQHRRLPDLVSLRVADPEGLVRYGEGVDRNGPLNVSDSEYFIQQRGNPKAGLVIGKPLRAPIGHEWSIPVSRRLNRPGGEFAGVVFANLPVAYFVKKFSSLQIGRGIIALRTNDFIALARYPEAKEGAGVLGQPSASDELRRLLQDNPKSVTYVTDSPSDHLERTLSYNKLANYPLYVVVGLASKDYQDELFRDALQMGAGALLFALMSLAFGWLSLRSWRRRQEVGRLLRDNEERWTMALEGGGFAIWDLDLQAGKVQLSDLGKEMFGYTDKEIGNELADWAQRCHPDDVSHVVERAKDHFRGRTTTLVVEFRVRSKDGSWRWLLARGRVVSRSPDGRPQRMVGTHSDVTDRHKREDELRLAATVFEVGDEAVMVTDPKNRIVSVNPAFTAITGYLSTEVFGRNPNILSAKTHSKAFYQEMWTALVETGHWRGEVVNRKKSGEVYIEWLSITRVMNAQGQLTHYVGVFSDIMAHKATQARMHHLSLHDALTDLPNRALLKERIQQALVRAKRDRSHLGLMYIDLDNFKRINDSYGYALGDLLLTAVAKRILDCVRASDTVARVNEDEFAVLLATAEEEQDALSVAEKIRDALCQPFYVGDEVLDISACIGLAIYPENGADEQALARHAHAALHRAMKNGSNLVYRSEMRGEVDTTDAMPLGKV